MHQCSYSPLLWVITMGLQYQRVLNFPTKLAKQGMNHYSFENPKKKKGPNHGLGEDAYLWINEWINEQLHEHVGTGCEGVNAADLPEATDGAERNWLNGSMTWADVNVCLVWSLTFPVPTATDSRKCSDVSPLNSISGGTDQQDGGGENKQAAQCLQLLLSHLFAFSIFFKNESAGFLHATETMHSFLLQLRSSLFWLSNLKCFLPNKKRNVIFTK